MWDVSKKLIKFYGFQSDPKPFYGRSHCIILPSYHEGMSNVLLEAAATGRAVITSNIPGCREAVDEGESGYLCEKMNADSLYDSVSYFWRCFFKKNSITIFFIFRINDVFSFVKTQEID